MSRKVFSVGRVSNFFFFFYNNIGVLVTLVVILNISELLVNLYYPAEYFAVIFIVEKIYQLKLNF